MKFAICNETFEDLSVEEGFAKIREIGYEGVEIAPFTLARSVYELSSPRRAQVRKAAEQLGLQVIGLHWLLAKTEGYYLNTPDDARRIATANYLCELARVCADLGGALMVLGSPQQRNLLPGISHDQASDLAADCLTRVVPVLERTGVTIAVEPLGPQEGNFLNTAALANALIKQVGSPFVKLHLDVKAMSTESIAIPDLIRAHAHELVHFHANDPNRQGPGMGAVDFVPILKALLRIQYRSWVSVEAFDFSVGRETLARTSLANLQKSLAITRRESA